MTREEYENAGVLLTQILRMKDVIHIFDAHGRFRISLSPLYCPDTIINLNSILSDEEINDILSMTYRKAIEKLEQAEKEFNEL